MKVRNNTNRDFQLIFSNGVSINLSRAEISREITREEEIDSALIKAIKSRWLVIYNEPNISIQEDIIKVAENEIPVREDTKLGDKMKETIRRSKVKGKIFGKDDE
jgi:hypothetical protein